MHEKLAFIIKHYPFIQFIYKHVMSFIFRIWGLFVGFDEHLVLISSMSGDSYSGSPKVLFDAMKLDNRFSGYRYVWAFTTP